MSSSTSPPSSAPAPPATSYPKSALKSASSYPRATPSPSPESSSNGHSSGRRHDEEAGPSTPVRTVSRGGHLQPPGVQFDSTPTVFAIDYTRRVASEPQPSAESMMMNVPETPLAGKGKRKADAEITPPERREQQQQQRATFAIPNPEPRSLRVSGTSGSSHAPSSYGHGRKRARLSSSTPLTTPPPATPRSQSRAGSHAEPNSGNSKQNFSSVSSRASSSRPGLGGIFPTRASSRVSRRSSATQPPSPSRSGIVREPKTSMSARSARSIPISALVSPHAPSITHSGQFHMRDPHKPPRRQPTGWGLRFGVEGEPGTGSPVHAWLFFLGFVFFFLWWVGAFLGTPKTRRAGGEDVEKAVVIDDPQVEYDAKSWKWRCRVMAAISLVTYIPFIVCVAIFAHR